MSYFLVEMKMSMVQMELKIVFFLSVGIHVKNERGKHDEASDEFEELYACEYCDNVFTNSTELLSHRETHPELNDDQIKYMEDMDA